MQFELTRGYIDDLRTVIEQKNENEALTLLKDLHAADIADIFFSILNSMY